MKPFDYIRPQTVAEAVAAASAPGSAYLAAGTNLLDLMKIGVAGPDRVVDITRLEALSGIDWLDDGSVRIGAMVRNADLAYDQRFSQRFPAVAEALLSGASAQLRNAASVGGNLMQACRCPYFQDVASACNRREPGSGCDALEGHNRLHAVLGWTAACIATHPSDFCVPLVALDATVEIEGPAGRRRMPLEALYPLPGDETAPQTVLEPGELITGLCLPAQGAVFAGHARYLKLRERTSYAFAVVSAAAMLTLDNGRIADARLALGAVAAKPWRARAAEQALIGAAPTRETFAEAARIALSQARPSGDNAFKIELSRRIATRALILAHAGTPAKMPALPGSIFSSHADEQEGTHHVA